MTETSIPRVTVEIPYARTLGPVISRFLTGLRDGELWANRTASGRVMCPPFEYDPANGQSAVDDWVQLPGTGVVTTWAWVSEPLRKHLLDRPFAWALIRLDGSDIDLAHAVDPGDYARMSTGMRVQARFRPRDERIGHIRDIECFEPESGGGTGR